MTTESVEKEEEKEEGSEKRETSVGSMVLWEKERQKLRELEQCYRASRARTLAAPNQTTYLYTSGLVRAQCQVERGRQQGKHSVCKLEGGDRLVSALSIDACNNSFYTGVLFTVYYAQ